MDSAHRGRLQKHYNQIFDVRIDEDFKMIGILVQSGESHTQEVVFEIRPPASPPTLARLFSGGLRCLIKKPKGEAWFLNHRKM